MTFAHRVEDVVQVVEAIGVAVMVVGGLIVLVQSGVHFLMPTRRDTAYRQCRRHLGRVILLGLEVLIIADLIRTVIVEQTVASVTILAVIVAIRIVLSWSLTVEIEGAWPWRMRDTESQAEGPRT